MSSSWEQFEHLVTRIHEALDGQLYGIRHNVEVTEESGGKHQIDVLLEPKSPLLGPVLVSCKSGAQVVGPDHVREWSDIVQQTGASAGVIVAASGFTSGAMVLARRAARRLSLWVPRPLSAKDFGPDDESQTGYISQVAVSVVARAHRPIESSFMLDVEPVGKRTGRTQEFRSSAANRKSWYLRDEQDNVVENLWDLYTAAATSLDATGVAEVRCSDPRILVLDGVRLWFHSLSMKIEVVEHPIDIAVDVTKSAFGYENVLTGDVRLVPLPPRLLEGDLGIRASRP